MNKKITTIVIVIVLIAAAAVVWLFMSGRLVWTDPNTKAVVVKAVCDKALVGEYNQATQIIGREGSSTPTIDTEALKKIKDEILAKDGYKTDPTCNAMLFWIAIRDQDYEAGKAAYEAVRSLSDQGRFANSNIRGDEPLFTYEEVLFTISPDADKENKVMGG